MAKPDLDPRLKGVETRIKRTVLHTFGQALRHQKLMDETTRTPQKPLTRPAIMFIIHCLERGVDLALSQTKLSSGSLIDEDRVVKDLASGLGAAHITFNLEEGTAETKFSGDNPIIKNILTSLTGEPTIHQPDTEPVNVVYTLALLTLDSPKEIPVWVSVLRTLQ